VIRHQCVCPNTKPDLDDLIEKDAKVGLSIGFIPEKHTLPVPPMSYVVRHSRNNDSRQFCH
jgi:hypothetical protein